MILRQTSGILRYSTDADDGWLVADLDPGLGAYYLALLPKHLGVRRGKYDTHCTIVRGGRDVPARLDAWGKHEGEVVTFDYEPVVRSSGLYYWLGILSIRFENIRTELGLPLDNKAYASPPAPFSKWFHTTIGNIKQ